MISSTEMERGLGGGFERDFARNKMGMFRSSGQPHGRGMGKKAPRERGSCSAQRFFLKQSPLSFHRLLKHCFLDLGKSFWSLNFLFVSIAPVSFIVFSNGFFGCIGIRCLLAEGVKAAAFTQHWLSSAVVASEALLSGM